MRPPFPYYGGKQGMSQLLVGLMPPHDVYIEPFFGSGAVFFAKPLVRHQIINDVDDAVVNFLRVLRDQSDELESVCRMTPHSRTEYEAAALDGDRPDDLEYARRFWVRVNQSFGKSAGPRTGWSVTVARSQSIPASIRSRAGRFAPCADKLLSASIESTHAPDLIRRLAKTDETVIYADPPYLGSTRSNRSSSAKAKGDYRADMLDDDAHRELAEALHETPATVILSGYPGDLYDDLYGDWWHHDVAVTVHSSNSSTTERDGRIERVWSNRDLEASPQRSLWDQIG